ncbi:MAG: precorrin-2 C(20)-methyltransferase [Desulfuromonadales bacterium]|nr:precorrin-2 C(20)-methyltransferase [Desulfuromonadales bacterium]
MQKPQPGHFYAVGIGPGSPDLLTVRAVNIIEAVDVILTPQARGSNRSLALNAIAPYLHQQEVMTVSYPMERNGSNTSERWSRVADEVLQRLQQGRSVAMITIGDPLIFATTSYLLYGLSATLAKEKIHLVPGISAFQIGASRFHDPLTLQEDRLTLMSATDLKAVENALGHCETLVLYKAAGVIGDLMALLKGKELLSSSRLVSCAEHGDQELVVENLETWTPRPLNYMTTVIVRAGQKSWQKDEQPEQGTRR